MIQLTVAAPAVAATAPAAADQLTGIAAWAVTIMESLGGLGVAFLIALENLFPPLPSEIILPLAGFTASQGTSFGLVSAIVWATAGSLVGAWALYAIARLIGRERTRAIFNWLPLVKMSDVDIFRSLISLPAGVIKMNLAWFTLLTTAGAAIWNTALVGAGYVLGENWHLVEQYVGILSYVVAAVVVVLLVWWVVKRLRANRMA